MTGTILHQHGVFLISDPVIAEDSVFLPYLFNNHSCMALAMPVLALLLGCFIRVQNYCTLSWKCSMFLSRAWLLLLCCAVALRTYFLLSSVPVLGCVGVIRGLIVCLDILAREGFCLTDWMSPEEAPGCLEDTISGCGQVALSKAPVSCLQRPSGQTLNRLEQDRIVWNETRKAMGRNCWELYWATGSKWHVSMKIRK